MKVLFLTPPIKAWDSHGMHKAANQMHAQAAAFIWYFNEALRMIKEKFPQMITVASGLWYSADYDRQMRLNPTIDYILIGEAEVTLEELLVNLKDKTRDMRDIPGLVSRRDKSTIVVGPHRG